MPCHDKRGNRFMLLPYVYDDGGRSNYFKAKNVNDCVCRAVSIVTGGDYREVYDQIRFYTGDSPGRGVRVRSQAFKNLMVSLGFKFGVVSYDNLARLRMGEIPNKGRLVCCTKSHAIAVIDGVVHDTYDSRFNKWGKPTTILYYWRYDR